MYIDAIALFNSFRQPKRKVYDDFWQEFEAGCAALGLVSTVPACMKALLSVGGYNNALSFKSVNESKIRDLEQHIETHHRKVADEFAEYAEMKPFQFLPGHCAFILQMKQEIENMQIEKKQKVAKKSRRDQDEQSLELSLKGQLNTYAKSIGFNLDWTHSIQNIVLTSTENSTCAQCSVSCPICFKSYALRYDRSWKVTNMYRHLRGHATASIAVENVNAEHSAESTDIQTIELSEEYLEETLNFNDIIEEEI